MNRRDILKAGVAAGALGLAPRLASAQVTFAPAPKGWRSYVLTTRVEPTDGATKAWIPLPTFEAADWQRPGNVTWTGNAKVAERVRDPKYGAEMLRVEWAADQQSPLIEVTAQVQTQDRSLVPGQGIGAAAQRCRAQAQPRRHRAAADRRPGEGDRRGHRQGQEGRRRQGARALRVGGREHLPQSQDPGLRRRRHHHDDQDRQPQRQVCRPQRALFVGLARSVGLPARDVYGIRVVPSQFGFKALGAGSENVTKAQHCRAEVWLPGSGWTPVDPADVRKVVLEEPPGNLAMSDPKVLAARKALFGSWEGNWVAFNDGARREAAGLEGAGHRLPDVSAGREQGRVPRFARPGQVQVPHHRA